MCPLDPSRNMEKASLWVIALAALAIGALWLLHVALIPVGAAIVLWKHGKVTRELMQPYLLM